MNAPSLFPSETSATHAKSTQNPLILLCPAERHVEVTGLLEVELFLIQFERVPLVEQCVKTVAHCAHGGRACVHVKLENNGRNLGSEILNFEIWVEYIRLLRLSDLTNIGENRKK